MDEESRLSLVDVDGNHSDAELSVDSDKQPVAPKGTHRRPGKKTKPDRGATPAPKRASRESARSETSSGLEASVDQVKERFGEGCECARSGERESCFANVNPETAYRHRLNIAELTRGEHDMYLMGVTMASVSNPEETARHKERKRLRTQYVFQGRKVCLEAFLYLENCTQYQLKRIRKHVMTHGVTPRVHGNHGKRPHNRFSLDIYQTATAFLESYIPRVRLPDPSAPGKGREHKAAYLPPDVTRKAIHAAYKEYVEHFEPGSKSLGYATFRHFMKRQFPLVKFTSTGAH